MELEIVAIPLFRGSQPPAFFSFLFSILLGMDPLHPY